jgi:FixJ family two-component response regulator
VNEPTVFVVDDDPGVRRSICALARSSGFLAEGFASSEEFLCHHSLERRGCLVLDLQLEGAGGLELQDELRRRGAHLPIIVMTGHGSVTTAVRALKGGAVDFLEKPVPASCLLETIREAVEIDRRQYEADVASREIAERVASLTPRERQVMERISTGQTSAAIAREFGLSVRTVEVHRQHMLHKMGVHSAAELANKLRR